MKSIKFLATAAFALVAPSVSAEPAAHILVPGHIDLATGPDGNTVILDTASGLVVVDTGRHPSHANAILARAKSVKKPVITIVNTHWHLDHTTGNRDILSAYPDAQLVASGAVNGALTGFLANSPERSRKRLNDPSVGEAERARLMRALSIMEDRAAFVPENPIANDTKVELGGRVLELRLAPNAATEGDIWMLVPDEKLAIVGDLVVAQFPFFDTGCEEGWRKALDDIEKASWDTLIPGHGAKMDRTTFLRWKSAFNGVLDCARSDKPSSECATRWQSDAAGFFTDVEREDVRELAIYYVDEILRAPPERRMDYCLKSSR